MRRSVAIAVLVPLVAVALLTALHARAQEDGKRPVVEEPETGIELPVTINVLDTMEGHVLTGVAVREKTIFAVDVYACGHYVREEDARRQLADWADKDAKELVADEEFRKKLVTPGFARTLRLHMARDVGTDDFNEAFDDSLKPRMRKLIEAEVAGDLGDLEKLKGLFTVDELSEGSKIDLTWKGTTLTARLDAKTLGSIDSDALCRALWDVYFGKKPIQSEFPRKLCARFPQLLETPKDE